MTQQMQLNLLFIVGLSLISIKYPRLALLLGAIMYAHQMKFI